MFDGDVIPGEDPHQAFRLLEWQRQSRTAFTMLKIAVLAPMPSAKTLTMAPANEGAGVAFIAVWLPAQRATRLDPVTALRQE